MKETIKKYNNVCGIENTILTLSYSVVDKILTINHKTKIEQNIANTRIWLELYDNLYGFNLEKYHITNINYDVKSDNLGIYDKKKEA